MLEDHLKLANPCRRLRSGPVAAYLDEFADWLWERGHPPNSRSLILRSLAAWTDWLTEKSFTAGDLVAGYEACRRELSEHGRVRYQRGPTEILCGPPRCSSGSCASRGSWPSSSG